MARVVMGDTDVGAAAEGWSPLEAWSDGGGPVRRLRGLARVRLAVPADPTHLGLECWVPAAMGPLAPALHVGLYDAPTGGMALLEACFRLQAGRWQVLEVPLRPLAAGNARELWVRLTPISRWRIPLAALPIGPRIAVRSVWLRERRVRPDEVTIVVLNWRRAEDTLRCLDSLAAADLGGARVLVVDNGSHDGSIEQIRARYPAQAILALPENRGYAGGNNAGIRAALAAGARAVLLLNNDTEVAPDFLTPLLWELDRDARIAAVAAATLRPDRETLELAWLRVHFGHGLVRRIGVHALPSEGYTERRPVPVVVGCAVLIAADALRAVGGLEEAYFAYHEEVDWCFRARDAGWTVHYQPLSRVFHAGSRSTSALVRPLSGPRNTGRPRLPNATELSWNPVRTYLGARNAIRFLKRHAHWYHWIYFVAATLYHMPLELFAVVLDHEEEYLIGDFNYRKAFGIWLFGRPETRGRGAIARGLVTAPRRLLIDLPATIVARHRDGRTAQLVEHLRGLWDGLRNQPPDLHRLGLLP